MKIVGEGYKVSKKKKTDEKKRVQTFLDPDIYQKFNRVFRACNISESQLAYDMISQLLLNPNFVNWIQDKYGVSKDDPFRIIPQTDEKGRIIY